jgi:molybdenum cofactor biosynthesis enzyme MoaA
MKKKNEKTAKFICPIPWVSLSLEAGFDFRLCCHDSTGNVLGQENNTVINIDQAENVESIQNHSDLIHIRKEMLAGKVPKNCEFCKGIELSGGYSPREEYSKRFSKEFNEALGNTNMNGVITTPVSYLDLTTDNNCNLKCRMCSPRYSQLITGDWDKIDIPYNEQRIDLIKMLDQKISFSDNLIIEESLQNVSLVTLTGGEPFLSKKANSVVDKLIEIGRAKEVEIRYFTNLTAVDSGHKDKWDQFKKVTIFASLDAAFELAEYLRFPCKWNSVDENLKKLIKWRYEGCPLNIKVHTVLSAYNVPNVTELFSYLSKFNNELPLVPSLTVLTDPRIIAAKVLPKHVLLSSQNKLQKFFNECDLSGPYNDENVLNMESWQCAFSDIIAQNKPEDFIEFTIYNKKLDSLRGQDIKVINPLLFEPV